MRVVLNEFVLDFHEADHCVLQHFLQQDAFLRMHHLVVAILQLLIDFNVLDVQDGVMVEPVLVITFVVHIAHGLVLLQGLVLQRDLVHQVV